VQHTILIVDDQELILRIIQAATKTLSLRTSLARSGEEALKVLEESGIPDLILLDYQMPGKDGVETLREIRKIPGGEKVPVIMLTARDQTTIRESLSDLGVSMFMTKPFSPALLSKHIAEILDSSRI
jgi:CheY-like chemotaxis protein